MEPPTLPSAKGLSHSASLPSERSPVEKPLGRSRNNWHGDLELDKAEMRWGSSADLDVLWGSKAVSPKKRELRRREYERRRSSLAGLGDSIMRPISQRDMDRVMADSKQKTSVLYSTSELSSRSLSSEFDPLNRFFPQPLRSIEEEARKLWGRALDAGRRPLEDPTYVQYTREMEQTGVQWDLAIRAHTAIATLLRARGRGVPHMLTLLGNSEERNKEARKRRAERRKRRAMKKRRRKKRLKREQTAAKEAAKAGETIDYGNVSDVSSVSSVSTSSVSESSGDEETMVLLRAGTKPSSANPGNKHSRLGTASNRPGTSGVDALTGLPGMATRAHASSRDDSVTGPESLVTNTDQELATALLGEGFESQLSQLRQEKARLRRSRQQRRKAEKRAERLKAKKLMRKKQLEDQMAAAQPVTGSTSSLAFLDRGRKYRLNLPSEAKDSESSESSLSSSDYDDEDMPTEQQESQTTGVPLSTGASVTSVSRKYSHYIEKLCLRLEEVAPDHSINYHMMLSVIREFFLDLVTPAEKEIEEAVAKLLKGARSNKSKSKKNSVASTMKAFSAAAATKGWTVQTAFPKLFPSPVPTAASQTSLHSSQQQRDSVSDLKFVNTANLASSFATTVLQKHLRSGRANTESWRVYQQAARAAAALAGYSAGEAAVIYGIIAKPPLPPSSPPPQGPAPPPPTALFYKRKLEEKEVFSTSQVVSRSVSKSFRSAPLVGTESFAAETGSLLRRIAAISYAPLLRKAIVAVSRLIKLQLPVSSQSQLDWRSVLFQLRVVANPLELPHDHLRWAFMLYGDQVGLHKEPPRLALLEPYHPPSTVVEGPRADTAVAHGSITPSHNRSALVGDGNAVASTSRSTISSVASMMGTLPAWKQHPVEWRLLRARPRNAGQGTDPLGLRRYLNPKTITAKPTVLEEIFAQLCGTASHQRRMKDLITFVQTQQTLFRLTSRHIPKHVRLRSLALQAAAATNFSWVYAFEHVRLPQHQVKPLDNRTAVVLWRHAMKTAVDAVARAKFGLAKQSQNLAQNLLNSSLSTGRASRIPTPTQRSAFLSTSRPGSGWKPTGRSELTSRMITERSNETVRDSETETGGGLPQLKLNGGNRPPDHSMTTEAYRNLMGLIGFPIMHPILRGRMREEMGFLSTEAEAVGLAREGVRIGGALVLPKAGGVRVQTAADPFSDPTAGLPLALTKGSERSATGAGRDVAVGLGSTVQEMKEALQQLSEKPKYSGVCLMQEKKNGIGMKQRKWVTLESFDELLCTPPVASLLIPTATADTKANEPMNPLEKLYHPRLRRYIIAARHIASTAEKMEAILRRWLFHSSTRAFRAWEAKVYARKLARGVLRLADAAIEKRLKANAMKKLKQVALVHYCAAVMQRRWRFNRMRKALRSFHQRWFAAIKIQSLCRCIVPKAKLAVLKNKKTRAATDIQRCWRGRNGRIRARRLLQHKYRMEVAKMRIQRARMKEMLREAAATAIQRVFRGWQARQIYKELMEEARLILRAEEEQREWNREAQRWREAQRKKAIADKEAAAIKAASFLEDQRRAEQMKRKIKALKLRRDLQQLALAQEDEGNDLEREIRQERINLKYQWDARRQKEIDRVRSDIIRLLEDDKDNEVLMEGVNLAKRELGLLEFGAVEGKGAGLKGQVLRFRYDLKTASDLTPDEQRFQKMIIKQLTDDMKAIMKKEGRKAAYREVAMGKAIVAFINGKEGNLIEKLQILEYKERDELEDWARRKRNAHLLKYSKKMLRIKNTAAKQLQQHFRARLARKHVWKAMQAVWRKHYHPDYQSDVYYNTRTKQFQLTKPKLFGDNDLNSTPWEDEEGRENIEEAADDNDAARPASTKAEEDEFVWPSDEEDEPEEVIEKPQLQEFNYSEPYGNEDYTEYGDGREGGDQGNVGQESEGEGQNANDRDQVDEEDRGSESKGVKGDLSTSDAVPSEGKASAGEVASRVSPEGREGKENSGPAEEKAEGDTVPTHPKEATLESAAPAVAEATGKEEEARPSSGHSERSNTTAVREQGKETSVAECEGKEQPVEEPVAVKDHGDPVGEEGVLPEALDDGSAWDGYEGHSGSEGFGDYDAVTTPGSDVHSTADEGVWERFYDPQSGYYYYANLSTGESVWEDPSQSY